jgi:hypothetical protein
VLANSRDVAAMFEKEHKHVLRDIESLIAKIGGSNFGPSSYVSVQGKTLPCYDMDRDGFTLLAMSFTGEKPPTIDQAGEIVPPAAPSPITFTFEGAAVRVISRDGEPWFVLADVCKVLEIKNAPDAAGRLKSDEKMTIASTDSHSGQRGGAQSMTIISEAGFYRLVLRSDKPAADPFQTWVVKEVIPAIRKTGSYGNQAPF